MEYYACKDRSLFVSPLPSSIMNIVILTTTTTTLYFSQEALSVEMRSHENLVVKPLYGK